MVGESLKAAIELLSRLEETAQVREMRARAHEYMRTVATWETKRPTHGDLSVMIQQVEALHTMIAAARRGDPQP